MRCYHESSMHRLNCFITLTYNDECLPEDYSVHKRVLRLFIKRLRKHIEPARLSFYGCGEYGPENLRPHYHAILFNYDLPDKVFWKENHQGDRIYTSKLLDEIWGFGFTTVGDVTYQSAGYCSQYVMKKINGEKAVNHYIRTHPRGYVVKVEPEFQAQSTRPAIGLTWFNKYHSDAFPSDFLVVDGKQHRVPAFYLRELIKKEEPPAPDKKYFEGINAVPSNRIKRVRKQQAQPHKANNTPERLAVRDTVKRAKISALKREL